MRITGLYILSAAGNFRSFTSGIARGVCKSIVTDYALFSQRQHYDMVHCVVDKFIVVPHWYMAVPSRDL